MQYFLLLVIMVTQIAVLALASSHPGFAPNPLLQLLHLCFAMLQLSATLYWPTPV
jgi:hypothetical protein